MYNLQRKIKGNKHMYRNVNKCLNSGNKIQPDSNLNIQYKSKKIRISKEVVVLTPPRGPAKEENPTRAQHNAGVSSIKTGKINRY